MILNYPSPELNQNYLIEHHKQTRNMLFAIMGYVYLLKNHNLSDSGCPAEYKEYLNAIEQHCTQLLEHEESLILRLLLQAYRQSLTPNQLN
ncbi:MAG: hypothetical protein ACP5PS_07120 [Bacteroidales bacterium]